MSRKTASPGTATPARFAQLLGKGDAYHVTQLAAAGLVLLTDDGKRVRVDESLERLRTTSTAIPEPQRTATMSGFARLLGNVSPSYVTQLKGEGRLVMTADGKRVLVDESIALIKGTRDPAKAGVAARHAANRVASTQPPESTADDDDHAYDGHATRRSRAQADKAEWDAKAAQRDYLESIGQLLPAGAVEAALVNAGTTLRTTLENLPDQLAPELAAATDEGRIRVLISEAIEHALEEISRTFAAIAKAEPA